MVGPDCCGRHNKVYIMVGDTNQDRMLFVKLLEYVGFCSHDGS